MKKINLANLKDGYTYTFETDNKKNVLLKMTFVHANDDGHYFFDRLGYENYLAFDKSGKPISDEGDEACKFSILSIKETHKKVRKFNIGDLILIILCFPLWILLYLLSDEKIEF